MPRFQSPHKTHSHRVAAIALYRALISQCKRVELPGDGSSELLSLVRYRFRDFRRMTSTRQLKVIFEAGYEAVDHLDAAVAGEEDARELILGMVNRAPRAVKATPVNRTKLVTTTPVKATPVNDRLAIRTYVSKLFRTCVSNTDSVLDRPRPHSELGGSRIRRVPTLAVANNIPFLRFKKPLPQSLSAYINSRLVQRQNRHDRRQSLGRDLGIAMSEDKWDALVRQHAEIDGGHDAREPQWQEETQNALAVVHEALESERRKNKAMAERMFDIVDREAALAKQEAALAEKQSALKRREEYFASQDAEEQTQLSSFVDDIISADDKRAESAFKGVYQPLG